MITTLDVKEADGNLVMSWFKAAKREPLEVTALTLLDYLYRNNLPVTFQSLDAAAVVPEIQGTLQWIVTPTPENYREITTAWLGTLPEKYKKGLPRTVANYLAKLLEEKYENHYTEENLNAAFAMMKKQLYTDAFGKAESIPEPKKETLFTNFKRNTGVKNHAHDNDAPESLTEQQAKEGVLKLLQGLANGGHKEFVKEANRKVKEQIDKDTPWPLILTEVHNLTTDYLAAAAVQEMIEGAPGGVNHERIGNRQHLMTIVKEGRARNMTWPELARMIRNEVEGYREHRGATHRNDLNTPVSPRTR